MDNTTTLLLIVLAVLFLTCNQSSSSNKTTPSAQPTPMGNRCQENFGLHDMEEDAKDAVHSVENVVEKGADMVKEDVIDPLYNLVFPQTESQQASAEHTDSTIASDNLTATDLLPSNAPTSFSENCPDLSVSGVSDGVELGITCNAKSLGMESQVLRNANLQLRSEPPNPQTQVSPWMNSTIEPDLQRVPLELGCGKQ